MSQIASFATNRDILDKGLYLCRIDGDILTYDIRMKKPNGGDYLTIAELHTLEHLFVAYTQNYSLIRNVIYVGPMGCRTGFYLLLRDNVSRQDAVDLVRKAFQFITRFDGEIPGSKRWECGNYLEHDLDGAKKVAADMLKVLKYWTVDDLKYKE
ncbi:MAG: S-ribosylhomocysteine lyase [Clostridia bacterium]|nr:S-ribosylhomocysteine lyase [Clostridia bacterium]